MTVYVSMLRAVNVGGTSRIKMDALRAVYESIGLKWDNVNLSRHPVNII